MAKKRKKRDAPTDQVAPRVWVCRGGDCGSRRKHPDIDHREQLQHLRREVTAPVTVTACLDACEHSNVVVVRRSGERDVWLGRVNDDAATSVIIEWMNGDDAEHAVGPEWHAFRPSRRVREELPG